VAGSAEYEDSQGDIAAAGRALVEAIRAAAWRSADGQVDLLGFSMGGLVSRWAINALRADEGGSRPLVNTAVLIATPSNGADILLWLSTLGQGARATLRDLAREIGNLDLDSIGAGQMLPNSAFLAELNRPEAADDRVRYVVMAGAAQLRLNLGLVTATVAIGDGVISAASASYLPGLSAQRYVLSEALGDGGQDPWQAIRGSRVFHPRLLLNDEVALAAAGELVPGAFAIRQELEARLADGGTATAT
jgi:pimeloyl-ACP methyl ester carboxylesterase